MTVKTRAWLLSLALLAYFLHAPAASAQISNAIVASSCNVKSYPAGQPAPVVQNTAGLVCTSASASGTFTDDATGSTGSPVPGSAAYTGLNLSGNLVGQTGVNPSGSIFAAQVDLTSVGGTTALRGNGVTGNGSPRVTIASDNTPFHIIVDTAPTTAVTGTFWQATQPVSAVSLPLPTGAATAAKQPALGTAGTPSADVLTVQGAATGTPLPVVEGGNSYSHIATATTTLVKSGVGVLHTICINTLGTVASSVEFDDALTHTTPVIGILNSLTTGQGCYTYDIAFATGLSITTTGTAAPDLTISFR